MGTHSKSINKNASFLLYPHASDKLSGILQDFFTVFLPLAESIGEIMSGPHDGRCLVDVPLPASQPHAYDSHGARERS
jgi:hypothetical protein